jgi:PAS domain S-box-containing protein
MIDILLVDDEPSLLEIAKTFLESETDFRVETADSAEEALSRLDNGRYDAIVSDYQMPGMNGIFFLRAVRSEGYDVPFILFTGRGREEVAMSALNHGASFYLQKGGDPKAQFAELMGMIRHAVEKREVEEALAHNERHFRSLIENAADVILIVNDDGTVLYVSPAATRVLGYTQDEIIGSSILNVADPTNSDSILGAMRRACQHPELPVSFEVKMKHKGGNWRYVECTAMRPPSGLIEGSLIINARDITERKMMEETLRSSELRLLSLIEGVQEPMCVVSFGSRITYANERMAALLGRPLNELVGRNLMDLLTGHALAAALSDLGLRTSRHPFLVEMTHGERDTRRLRVQVSPLWDDCPTPTRALVSIMATVDRQELDMATAAADEAPCAK